jgi:alkylhydroperoxidase/carboxymuconolactone decarboxylase family protein YurZ
MVARGDVRPVIFHALPLEEAARAHTEVESGPPPGASCCVPKDKIAGSTAESAAEACRVPCARGTMPGYALTERNPLEKTTFDTGYEIRSRVLGKEHVENAFNTADEFTAPLQELVTEYCWAVWGREGLSGKTRSMLNLAMLSAPNRPHEIETQSAGPSTTASLGRRFVSFSCRSPSIAVCRQPSIPFASRTACSRTWARRAEVRKTSWTPISC